jgi:hypothetical protein
MGMRYTQEQIERIFTQQGCILKDQYQNNHTPVTFICVCGTWSDIRVADFLMGHRCKICGDQNRMQKRTLKHEDIEKYFESQGCVLLSKYTHHRIRLQYRCSCGNISTTLWHDFKAGHRCEMCGHIRTGQKLTGNANGGWKHDREAVWAKRNAQRRMGQLLRNCLKRLGRCKEERTSDILGYSPHELMAHIQAHWNWVNVDPNNYHIDHIFPIQAFIDHGISDPRIINALDNLRPCKPFDNLSKGDWYNEEHFVTYCQKHGIQLQQKEVQNGKELD